MRSMFYSWQSDLPNKKNRGFIDVCIDKAIKECNDLKLDIFQDRDTLNVPGTPDICETIFEKIDNCDFFIADISIINADYECKKTPNPNVLIELGYAAKVLGWNRIICIFNNEYGKVSEIPFDLRARRILTYSSQNWDLNNPDIKKKEKERIIQNIISTINCVDSNNDNLLFEGFVGIDTGIIPAKEIYRYKEVNVFYREGEKEYQCVFKSKNYPNKFGDTGQVENYDYNNLRMEVIDAFNIKFHFDNYRNTNCGVTRVIGTN